MSNFKYCSSCGAKTTAETSIPKFCSRCGQPFALSFIPKRRKILPPSRVAARSESQPRENTNRNMGFVIPKRFEYNVEGVKQERLTINEIAAIPPDEDRRYRPQPDEPVGETKKMSLQEFKEISMKECASSRIKDIGE